MLIRLLVILVLLAGIGFGGYTAYHNYYLAPERVVARASASMSNLQTVHADMDIAVNSHVTDSQGVGQSQTVTIKGISDMNIPDKTQKTHMTMQVAGSSMDIDMILLKSGQIYLKMPILNPNWLNLNTTDLQATGSIPFDPQSNDYVTQSLGFLKSMEPGSITRLEDDTVDGIRAYRYRVDISTSHYIDFLKSLNYNQTTIEGFQNSSIKTDIWVDQKTNNIVKLVSDIKNIKILDPKTGNTLATSDMNMQLNYSKFNQSVDISAPTGTVIPFQEAVQQSTPAQ